MKNNESIAFRDRSISEIGLSNRAYNSLRNTPGAGIRTVRDLENLTEHVLLAVNGIGWITVEEIKRALAEGGLRLAGPLTVRPATLTHRTPAYLLEMLQRENVRHSTRLNWLVAEIVKVSLNGTSAAIPRNEFISVSAARSHFIFQRLRTGASVKEVAREFGLSTTRVRNIVRDTTAQIRRVSGLLKQEIEPLEAWEMRYQARLESGELRAVSEKDVKEFNLKTRRRGGTADRDSIQSGTRASSAYMEELGKRLERARERMAKSPVVSTGSQKRM